MLDKNGKKINDGVRSVPIPYFSTSQVNAILPGNSVREWQEDDIILTSKGYRKLRKKLKYPADVIAYSMCCRMLSASALSTGN